MTGKGEFVELQATGERATFRDDRLAEMIGLARTGITELLEAQRRALGLE
jgi:ribonuclease PH